MEKVKNTEVQSGVKLNPIKKIIFPVILIIFPLIFLVIIESFLRIINYGDNYNLFIETDFYGKEYKKCNPDFGKKYFYRFPYTSPANDMFLKFKPENCFRIFVIGSSTVYGFPYSSGIMFSRILHQRLQDSYPDKYIEVVNTAITAVNSYTFIDKIDEILKEKPDAILFYAGHNEFYGAMGIGSKEGLGEIRSLKLLHLDLLEFKTYQLIRNIILGLHKLFISGDTSIDNTSATLMERIVSNKSIGYKCKLYINAHEQYYKNIESILKKANKKNVPVFISELISNVKDLKPFCSVKTNEYPAAIDIYNDALEFKKKEEFEKASKLFYKAKDLDCIRFRASEEINQIIHQVANNYQAYLVPMKNIFENNSLNGLIGNNLVTEHVHPNIDGYFLMAEAFYTSIIQNNIIGKIDSVNYKPSGYYRKNWGFTELDSLYADIKIRQLTGGWPFKSDTIINQFIYNYKPATIIDSLAYKAVRYDDISLDIVHKKLAHYYILQKEFKKAYQEFYSLIKINPYDLKNYVEAGNLLFDLKEYNNALELFLAANELHNDNYVISKIGEIYSLKSEFENAIPYLEELRKNAPDFLKQKVIKLLYTAYKENNQPEKANNIFPEFSEIQKKNEDRERIIYTPSAVKEYIDRAMKQLKSGNYDKALSELLDANEIKETNVANMLIGEIYLQKKNKDALPYLKKSNYEYNSDINFLNVLCYAAIIFNDLRFAEQILSELKQLSPNHPNINKYQDKIINKKHGKL
jgi:tetratricopeptide (TPR) repeat protein/lysophospholipase L1-like esterase